MQFLQGTGWAGSDHTSLLSHPTTLAVPLKRKTMNTIRKTPRGKCEGQSLSCRKKGRRTQLLIFPCTRQQLRATLRGRAQRIREVPSPLGVDRGFLAFAHQFSCLHFSNRAGCCYSRWLRRSGFCSLRWNRLRVHMARGYFLGRGELVQDYTTPFVRVVA